MMTRNKNFQVLLKYATLCLIDNLLILKNKVKSSDFLEVILNPLLKYTLIDFGRRTPVGSPRKVVGTDWSNSGLLRFPHCEEYILTNNIETLLQDHQFNHKELMCFVFPVAN